MGTVKDITIDSGASVAGAGVGLVVAGPVGAIIGAVTTPVLTDVLHRMLSRNEKSRIEKVADLAKQQIQEKIKAGVKPTVNAESEKVKDLFEGTLLAAKDAYEEKKIPLLANLFASAPFSQTPINNLVQALISAEQLSYRQLCVLSVIGTENNWGKLSTLADKPLFHGSSSRGLSSYPLPETQGIYEDLNNLMVLGIIGQVFSEDAGPAVASGSALISPSKLRLMYPGLLLYDAMQLESIDKKDYQEIVDILK